MAAALKSINPVVLFVSDVERAKSFYRDTLGLTVGFEDEESAYFTLEGASLLLLGVSGAQGLLTPEAVATERPAGERAQLVSFVEDVDALYADLVARGVHFIREPIDREWGLRTAHFTDPDGHIWEIAHSLGRNTAQE